MEPATWLYDTRAIRLFMRYAVIQDGCWEWMGSCNSKGYPQVRLWQSQKPVSVQAHRISFSFFNGPIPEDHCVCHRCDNPRCTNPDHLFAGTRAENHRDMISKGRCIMPPLRIGENVTSAKLTDKQAVQIHEMLNAGLSQEKIAKHFGIGQTTVSLIKRGETWKHLNPRLLGLAQGGE